MTDEIRMEIADALALRFENSSSGELVEPANLEADAPSAEEAVRLLARWFANEWAERIKRALEATAFYVPTGEEEAIKAGIEALKQDEMP